MQAKMPVFDTAHDSAIGCWSWLLLAIHELQ